MRTLRILACAVLATLVQAQPARTQGGVDLQQYYGNRFVYAELQAPNNRNPLAEGLNSQAIRFREFLYEGLYGINKRGQYEPVLATGYSAVSDTVLRVQLRGGVIWHDGQAFTSDDVVFTYNCLLKAPAIASENLRALRTRIRDVTADGPSAVLFTFPSHPRMPEDYLTVRILPKHAFSLCSPTGLDQGLKDLVQTPVGTGPYKFAGCHIAFGNCTVVANRNYYQRPVFDRDQSAVGPTPGPFIDEVMMRPYPAIASTASDLQGGTLQLIPYVYPEQIPQLRAMQYVALVPYQNLGVQQLYCNYRNPVFRDGKFRQALSNAINRSALIGSHLANQAEIASGPYPGGHSFCPPSPVPIENSPEMAAQLLGEIGYKRSSGRWVTNARGEPVKLILMVSEIATGEMSGQICQGIKGYLETAGIQVVIKTVTPAQKADALKSWEGFDLMFTRMQVGMNSSLIPYSLNSMNLSDDLRSEVQKFAADLGRAEGMLDAQRQVENDFHERMVELMPSIYLWIPRSNAAYSMDLHNVDIHPTSFFSYVRNWYVKEPVAR